MTAVPLSGATAFHEAGHIVVGLALGLVLGDADIVPAGDRAGVTRFEDDRLFEYEVPEELVDAWGAMTWAGVLAQERAGYPDDGSGFGHTADGLGAASGSDLASLLELIDRFVGEDGDEASARWQALADQTIDEHWSAVQRVAAGFLTSGRLSAREAVRLVEEI
jgi:hypothetical protein